MLSWGGRSSIKYSIHIMKCLFSAVRYQRGDDTAVTHSSEWIIHGRGAHHSTRKVMQRYEDQITSWTRRAARERAVMGGGGTLVLSGNDKKRWERGGTVNWWDREEVFSPRKTHLDSVWRYMVSPVEGRVHSCLNCWNVQFPWLNMLLNSPSVTAECPVSSSSPVGDFIEPILQTLSRFPQSKLI